MTETPQIAGNRGLAPVRHIGPRAVRNAPSPHSFASHLRLRGALPPMALWRAQGQARDLGLRLDEVLLAEGMMTAQAICDALAAFLHLPRLRLMQGAQPDQAALAALGAAVCLRHAIVPLRTRDGARWLVLRHPDTRAVVADTLPPDWRDARPVLATEAEIQSLIATTCRDALTHGASARVCAAESCRTWDGTAHRRVAVTLAVMLGFALLCLIAPVPVFSAFVLWASATLVVAGLHKTAAALACLTSRSDLTRPQADQPAGLPDRLPRMSVLVPLYRERDVATHLVRRLSRLSYPKPLLDVVLVLEDSDDTTRAALANTTLPPWMRSVIVPDGAPRTKPRAMNYALDFCRGDIIGIWDAEDAPEPDQLSRVAARFAVAAPDVACLQGVLDYYNPRQNWLARCFTIEYATWFRLMMPGMARLGFAIPLGGTTLFFRRDVLEQLGGWDAHNVTEDADLGFRLARHGWRTEMIATTTGEEANCHLWPWVRQRSRWLKGYMITWMVHMRDPVLLWRHLGPWQFVGMQTHFITALSQFLLAPLLWSFWLVLLGGWHPLDSVLPRWSLQVMGGMFLAVECVTMLAALVALRGPAHRHLMPWVPTLHLYFPLGCLAAYKAMWELVTAPFYWDKTAHGLSLPATPVPDTAPATRSP